MQVATIVPEPYLHTIKGDKYHMCLYQEVISNPAYAEFYRKEKEAGSFLIMDNGAAEGVNPTAAELLPSYSIVNPDEVVLPDIVYSSRETLARTSEAYNMFVGKGLHKTTRFMAVPQGNTFEEWLWCLKAMIKQAYIKTIGVSKFVTPKYAAEIGSQMDVRKECVDAILTQADIIGRDDIEIHLLGCWDNPKEIGNINRAYRGLVRGTDSAIAYVHTRNGSLYSPHLGRPDNNEIDFKEGDQIDLRLFEANKQLWKNYCNGNLELIK